MVTAQDLFGSKGDNKNPTAQDIFGNKKGFTSTSSSGGTQSIKDSLKDVNQSKYGFTGSFVNDVKGFFGDIGDLVSYGWTEFVSNKDNSKGINDWDEYKKRMKQMSTSESAEEYNALYQKMVQDNIVDKDKYEQYQADEKAGKYYKFEQAKSADKQTFFDELDNVMSPIMSKTSNRYQIDSLSKGLKKIEDQYSMFYENVMETYKDTRDERILDEWNKIRKEYENNILQFTKNWANNMVDNNITFSEAYSKTLGEGSNEAFANGISKIERQLSDKMFKFTINQNLTDVGTAAASFNLLKTLDQTLLGLKNGITWGVKQVSNLLEEAKQLGGRYDVVEELTNLRVFDEDANALEKAVGNLGRFANTLIDSLPAYGPAVAELVLARKVEPGMLKTTDKLMDIWKAGDLKRFGTTLGGATLKELALDNLVYDEVFQNMIGRPISNEDENINLMFNLPLDFLQGALQANARWFKPAMKASAFTMDEISPTMLKIIKTSGDSEEELTKLAEKVYLLKGLETTEGTKEAKAFNKGNNIKISSIKEEDEALYNKITKAMNDASGYWDRLTKYEGSAEDLLLGIEEKLGKGVDKLSTIDKLNKASEMVWRQGKFITEAGDNLMLGAKTIGKTIGDLLLSGKISQEDIKVIIKTLSNIAGIDDLIIGLSKGDKDMVNNSLASLTSRQVELGANDINQLYNNILAKLMKQYPELKEFDAIGTYYKGADGLYRNILGDDTRYTADELIDMLGKQSDYNIVGSEEAVLVSNINNAIENLSKLTDDQKLEVKDLTNVFSGLQGGNIFRNWDTKTEAQKKMISQIIHDAGFNFSKAKDEAGNDAGYVQVFGTLANLESLKTNMLGLSGKSLAELTNKDIAAFKILYANDFINSFERYLNKVGNLNDVNKELVEKGLVNPKYNSTDFAKSYKSWFESMFEVRTIKDQKGNEQKVYKLKPAFDNEDISSQFTTLMSNSAAYKDIESYAAQNIIKDITSKVVNLDASDEIIYNAIHKAVTEGRYVKGYEKEITPVVNSLFNQVKWLGSLGMDANDSATVLGRLFGEIVVDEGTLRTLSRLDSDSLYKGIISRLLLDNDEATALYADSLYKLFDGADAESKVGLKKVIESVEVLGSKLKKETELKQAGNELKKELSNVNRNIKKLQGKEDKGAKRIISKLEGKKKQLIKDYRAKYGAYFDKEGQLTLNEPMAINLDRSALLSKLQGYLENVNPTKFYNKLDELDNQLVKRSKFEKNKGTKVTNSEIVIDRLVGASNEDLRLISNLAAYKSFKNANLPVNNEADALADEIYHSLAMLKEEKDTRKVIFNMGEVKELTPDAINLSVLTETKLLSNIFSQRGLRYAVGSALTSKTTGTSTIDWMNDIKNYIKNVSNRAGMKNIGKEYLMLLSGVEKYIKYGDTAKEQLQSIIETLKTSALLDKNIVVDDLVKSYNTSLTKGDIGLNTNRLFAEKLSKATTNLDKTISDLYTTAALYDKVLSNSEKKDILNILGKLEETGRMFDRMGELSKTTKKLNEQDIKKILTTDFSIDELSKKDSLIYKGSNPLEAPKRTGNIEINKLRTRGTNERVDDFDVTKPSYDLGDRKLVVYDLETTSTEKDADVLQISYTIISQGKDGKFNVQRHTGNLYDTNKDIDPKASEITGIKKEDLKGKPIFVETKGQGGVYDEFDALSKDPNVLFVGHNIRKFDNEVLHNAGIHIDNDATIDTLTLYQNLIDRVKSNYKLENVPSNFPNIAKALEDMKITSHNADYDTVNNYYLLNYLAEFALHNNKIDANKSVIDEFVNLSKVENNKSLGEDTSKSLLQRQVFFEGGQSETNVKAGNSVLRALDNAGFKEGNTVGLEDVLPFLGSSLSEGGESRIIAMFEGLKRILPEGATIDKNKLFVGGNVKKAYEEYAAELGFDAMSLDDFVLNRIVNSLLTEHGLYNDNTIEALNNYLKRSAKLDLISRLVTKTDNNWIQGSTDFIAMGTMFERLYNKALIGKGIEKNSPAYKDMMDEFREYVFNNHNVDLMRFNKSYYQYLLTGDGRYAYSARNIFSIIMEDMFIKQPIQAEDAVIEGGRNINEPKMAKYWNPEQQAVDVVGEFTRSSSRLSPESVNVKDLDKVYDELEERLSFIDEQVKELKKKKRLEKDASKKKEFDEQIAILDRRYKEIAEEQNEVQYQQQLSKYYSDDYESIRNVVDESEEAAEGEIKTEQEVLEEVYNGAEDIEKETPLENDTIKYGENVQSVNEEGAGSAEASRISTLDTETTNALEGDLWNELEDDIIAKGNIEMNNMFHIIEDDKSVYDYKGGQFNTAISMDARINNGADKDKLLEKLNQMDTSYKGDDNIKSFEKGQNGFIYNARNYLEGNDLRVTDEQYLKVYSLDSMIGKDIKEGTVTSISIEPTWFDRSVASSAKSEYNHKVFEYKDDFDLYGMLDSIVEVMKRGRGTFILNISHITHKNGKEFVNSIPYSLEQLWISPIGKALLNKMDIDESYGRYGADAVMKAIEHKMGPTVLNEKLNKDTLMRKYLDVVEIEEGGKTRKLGPRRNWDEDTMVDALGLSTETKWKYIKDLPNSEKKKIASSVAKKYEEKAKAAAKASGNGEELSTETIAKIKSIGPESLDSMENLRLYFSQGLISYASLDESAKRAGYKDMADFIYQTAVNNEGEKKAMNTLGRSLVGDNGFKREVQARYNGKLLNLYNKIDSYYSSASDSLLDRLKKYVVKGEDGTEYEFSAYIPDFLEISERYEKTPVKPTMIPKDEKGNFVNEDFYEGRYFQDSEDIQVLHGDRWISDEDGLYQLSMDIQKSDDYNTVKNISDPGEIVVRMYNRKTNNFEYGIIKVNDGYYGRNAEGQFEGKPTTYEFYPFEGDKRFEDPLSNKDIGYDNIGRTIEEWEDPQLGHMSVTDDGTLFLNGKRRWGESALWINRVKAEEAINKPSVVNGKTVGELAKEYNIPLFVGQDEWLKNIGSPNSIGRTIHHRDMIDGKNFIQSMINLKGEITEGTDSHELFHAVIGTLCPRDKAYFIDKARKLYNYDDVEANEMLADLFSEYFRTGSFELPRDVGNDKTFADRINKFFLKLSTWLHLVDDYKVEINNLFDDILSGKLKTSTADSNLGKGAISKWNDENIEQWKNYLVYSNQQRGYNAGAYNRIKGTVLDTENSELEGVVGGSKILDTYEGARLREGRDVYGKKAYKEGNLRTIESQYQLGERVGPLMKYDWKNENFKEVLPEGATKNHIILNENTVKDLDTLSQMDAMSVSTNGLWKTRAFSNWTNYDFFDKDKDIQQIVGDRVRFINEQGDNLRAAIDKFDEVLAKQEYTPEEVEKVYTKIRQTAHSYIGNNMGEAKELKIDELPDELVDALNGIAKVFVDGQWTPVHQFATLGKDGFESVLKNIAHNHLGSSLNYFKLGSRDKAKANLLNIIKKYEPREKQALQAAEDLVGDPLGTGAMYSFLTGVRSAWRFIKYGPLFPLTGVLMLVNSAVMGTIRYVGEKRGFTDLMNSPWFEALITKAGDNVNIGGVNYKGLGMTDSLNRSNEIMFNSNSDLGGSWFDKCLDAIIKPLPEGKTKTAITTALKGGTHSLYDLFAQGSVKTMAFAKALARNGITENNIEAFVKAYNDKLVSKEEINKILGDTERIYSRFFTNSATAFFSRHRFSRMYMFNALQGYVINRTDEITSSIKNCVNWLNHRHQLAVANGYKGLEGTTWTDFVHYLKTDNQELQSFLMNILMSAKIGFYMQKMVDGGDMDTENYRRYMIDTSDYLSSIEANFVYSLLMSPFEGMVDYAEYTQNNYDSFDLGQGLTVSGLKTVSDLCSKFFREGKILNAFMDSIVAYGQTGKVDFAYDVLLKDFQKIADGLGRFQLVEGTNLYGLDTLGEDRDILGQILFNNDQTSNSGRVTSKLQSFATVDSILNGEAGSFWKDKMLPYLPIIGPAIQNAIGGNGYSFSAAKYDELIHIMDKDKVVQVLNNWDLGKDNGEDIFGNSNIYSDESIGRMYQELTAFDYPNKQQLSGGKFETGYEYSNEPMKEEVFTKEMLDELGWSEQDLEQFLLDNSNGKNKQAGLMKIMAAAEASRPGSSKIVLSYLASQYENDRIKEITGDKYGSWKDLSVQAQNDLQRETVSKFYPYMFLADKTSWYKAITEYVSGKYELFDSLYKDDNLQGYVNTLGYMDMLMYQQAQDGNVNAKFIKNSWSMLTKYMKSEPARINAINYIMDSINKSDMSNGQAVSAKMGVLAANMDFYDKYYKNGMAQALYGEDLERYNNYVWGVLKDINEIGLQKASQQKNSSTGKKKRSPYTYSSPLGENNVPEAQKFIPQAQKYLRGKTPGFGGYSKYTPNTYKPGKTLDWYWKYYEALIKVYSDRLVKSKGKKYPAETIESITFKTGSNNKGAIKGKQLEFPKHKSKEYRTKLFSNLPGSHG